MRLALLAELGPAPPLGRGNARPRRGTQRASRPSLARRGFGCRAPAEDGPDGGDLLVDSLALVLQGMQRGL
ncbi:MAG: hypothetical protein K6U89_16290 [Chloroflexi bacterium]|nr:hypothetical protein [Chloroflexota bacterium]